MGLWPARIFEALAIKDRKSTRSPGPSLVNRAAPLGKLQAATEVLLTRILSKPRLALALGKQLFYRQLEVGGQAAYDDAAQTMACNMMDATALEGVQAFVDKRKPGW